MSKNFVDPGRLRMTTWGMRFAYLRLQTHTQNKSTFLLFQLMHTIIKS